jgi:uncharacterized OB-fold protein
MTRNPALLAGLAHADKLQKPDAVQGHCSDDGDVYFPPNDNGVLALQCADDF